MTVAHWKTPFYTTEVTLLNRLNIFLPNFLEIWSYIPTPRGLFQKPTNLGTTYDAFKHLLWSEQHYQWAKGQGRVVQDPICIVWLKSEVTAFLSPPPLLLTGSSCQVKWTHGKSTVHRGTTIQWGTLFLYRYKHTQGNNILQTLQWSAYSSVCLLILFFHKNNCFK